MRKTHRHIIGCALTAAILLSACGKGSSSSGSDSMSVGMGGASSTPSATQQSAWRTGLGVVTELEDGENKGTVNMVAAAVVLDGEGKIVSVMVDELDKTITTSAGGTVTMPTDYRTKRQMGEEDYPMGSASSIGKGWSEQVDAFGAYLQGMTGEQVGKLETDEAGKASATDLVAGCTIAVDTYRDAVAKACANAQTLGASRGDTLSLGIEAMDKSSGLTATDDQDGSAKIDVTFVALTEDADGRVTSAICDMAEAAMTVSSDGRITASEEVRTKLEQGDDYGMRKASALGKEWYEQSEGFCTYLKGKTAAQIAAIPDDGSQEDLASLCTISITAMQTAALRALNAGTAA